MSVLPVAEAARAEDKAEQPHPPEHPRPPRNRGHWSHFPWQPRGQSKGLLQWDRAMVRGAPWREKCRDFEDKSSPKMRRAQESAFNPLFELTTFAGDSH